MQRFPRTLFAATFALVLTTVCQAQIGIKRKPLSLSLFLKPFQPQTVTPQLFGLLPENEYLQKEIKLTAAQKKRMREIEIQLTRVSTALRQPDVRKAVGVTDTQLKRFAKHRTEARKKAQKFGKEWAKRRDKRKKAKKRPTRKELAEFRKRAAAIDGEYDKAVFNELTRVQKERFEKLKRESVQPAKIFNKSNTLRTQFPGLGTVNQDHLRSQPYKLQVMPPKVFGVLPDIKYLQQQLNLTATQIQRMKGVEYQLTRDVWVIRLYDDLRKALSISAKQAEEIRQLHLRVHAQHRKHFKESVAINRELLKKSEAASKRGDNKALRKLGAESRAESERQKRLMRELQDKLDKDALNVLTDAQRRQFKKLKGKPIDPVRVFQRGNRSKPPRPDV